LKTIIARFAPIAGADSDPNMDEALKRVRSQQNKGQPS
jgi:hypothetical protein